MDPRNAAREYLLAAERYIKDSLFDEALREVKKAQEIDPSNIYTFAFLERIEFFRQQKAKENNESQEHKADGDIRQTNAPVSTQSDPKESDSSEMKLSDTSAAAHQYHQNHESPEEVDNSSSDNHSDEETTTDGNKDSFDAPNLQKGQDKEDSQPNQDRPSEEIRPNSDQQYLFEKFEALESRVETLSHTVENFSPGEDISTISEKLQYIEEQIHTLRDSLTKQHQSDKMADLESRLLTLTEHVASLENTIRSHQTEIPDIDLVTKLLELERQIELVKQAYTDSQSASDNNNTEAKLHEIERKLNDLAMSIEGDRTRSYDFYRFDSLLKTLQDRVEQIASSFATDEELAERHSQYEHKYEEVKQRLAVFENRLDTIAKSIQNTPEVTSAEVKRLSERLDRLQETMQQFTSPNYDIKNLESRLFQIETRIQNLGQEITGPTESSHFGLTPEKLQDLTRQLDSITNVKKQVVEFGEKTEHLFSKYTELERRVEEFAASRESERIIRAELDSFGTILGELTNRVEDISRSTIREHELQETQTEILSLYTDLENRLNDLTAKYAAHHEQLRGRFTENEGRLQHLYKELENHSLSRSAIGEIERQLGEITKQVQEFRNRQHETSSVSERLEQIESAVRTLQQEFETETGTHKKLREVNNAIDAIYQQIEEILETLHFEKEIRSKQKELDDKLMDATATIDSLSKSVESILHKEHVYSETQQNLLSWGKRVDKELNTCRSQIDEITQQLTELNHNLQLDRQERENLKKRQLDASIKHFRASAEKLWEHGTPSPNDAAELNGLATLFGIPEPLEKQIIREVKLEMYSRAVKKTVAERKASKSELPPLETLRKRYDISLEEYVEYESQFIEDLLSGQFHGTILIVSSDESLRSDLGKRLDSVGFAVVTTPSPETALEKLEVVNPQVIISDATFANSTHDGLNLLRVLRKSTRFNFLPFVMLCHSDKYDELKTELKRPNESLVLRPVEFYSLLNTINEKLNRLREHLSSHTL